MESEERPSKMRKLDYESNTGNPSHPEAEILKKLSPAEPLDATIEASEASENQEKPEQAQQPVKATTGSGEGNADNEPPQDEPLDAETVSGTTSAAKSTSQFYIDPTLSKNQQKKLRKKLEWEAGRDERKLIRKEKQKEKRERVRAVKASLPPKVVAQKEAAKLHKPRPRVLPVTFLIDCDFDDLMRDGERTSLSSQITRCYSGNRNSAFQAHLTLASFGGLLKERYDTILEGVYKSYKGFRTFSENFVEVAELAKTWMADSKENFLVGSFAKYADQDQEELKVQGEVIYLSAEADEDIVELKPYSTYIIGGLVDKNREKGICYKRATAAGVKTKKLPIGKFMDMDSRKVLTTNHVNEIMVRWLECGDWGEAFMKVIPKRKGGTLKGGSQKGNDDEDDE